MFRETHARSIVKTLTWRITATVTTFLLVLIFTGKLTIALTVGVLEVFVKMLFYFFHERIWNKVKFGRHPIEPFVLWFTGLSGSGKSELANEVYEKLKAMNLKVDRLDGHRVREIFPNTGFSREEVNEHIERVGYLASKLEANGVMVVASFLSPYAESRDKVRSLCKNFIEIFVDTPLTVCQQKDIDRIYTRFQKGEIHHLPGMDAPYDRPIQAELILRPQDESKEEMTAKVMQLTEKYL